MENAERSRAEQSRAEQSGMEQSRAERSRAVQSRVEQSGAEWSRAEQIQSQYKLNWTELEERSGEAELQLSGKPPTSCRLDRSVQLGCGAHIVGPKAPVPNQVM